MKKIGIYIIISPSGRVYIGESHDIDARWKTYHYGDDKNDTPLYRSFRKHLSEKHYFRILELYTSYDKEFNVERETWWKQYYLDLLGWENVLFCKLIDGINGKQNEETKRKIGLKNIGIKKPKSIEFGKDVSKRLEGNTYRRGSHHPEEVRLRISQSQKNRYKLNKMSKETCEKISKGVSVKIIQYDLQNKFIKEWNSIKQCSEALKIPQSTISAVLVGRLKGIKRGFTFQYA